MTEKRPLALREGEQTTKKAKYTCATAENDSLEGEAVESLRGQPRFSPIHGTDISQDWPLVDVDSADTQNPFSICTGFTNEHDQLAHRRIPVAGGVGAATPNILPQSSEGAGGITISVTTSGAVTSRPTTPFLAYDACFGLLYLQATASDIANVPAECTPVSLKFGGNLVRIFLEGAKKPIAIIVSDALPRLVRDFAVTITATLCGKNMTSLATKAVEKPSAEKIVRASFCSLRIIIYGFLGQMEDVAHLLSKGDLFLQHPCITEVDKEVKYVNPQYFLAPGEEMPPIEKLSIPTCCSGRRSTPSGDSLGECEKNQILKIFDTASKLTRDVGTIEPSSRLVTKLKRHQKEALIMMIEKEVGDYIHAQFPAMWKGYISPSGQVQYQNILTGMFEPTRPPPLAGGILADEMGLGKTLSSLSLVCHSLDNMDKSPNLSQSHPRTTLVVTPMSTIPGWERQIKLHIEPGKVRWTTYHGPKRQELMHDIRLYDLVLTTYDTLRSDEVNGGPLFEQEWARVILDEAHKIRNRTSKKFKAACAVRAQYRWCLSGTPIQNSLDDFGALLAFINVPSLQSKEEFYRIVVRPTKEKKAGRLENLRKIVAATCLRRTKVDYSSVLNLPRKTERVEEVEMGRNDRQLYEFFKRFSYLTAGLDKTSKRKAARNILVLISMLRLICDHGEALLPESALKAWRDQDEHSLTWEMLESSIRRCVSCNCEIEELDAVESAIEELKCRHALCEACVIKSQNSVGRLPCPKCETALAKSPSATSESSPPLLQAELVIPLKPRYPPSAKIEALLRNITQRQTRAKEEKQPLKMVIFSYWTKMLDLIGAALGERGLIFQRIDGQSSLSQRKEALEKFGGDPLSNIMLASIGAGGEGIDLSVANSVHIVEPHWNPMAEAQAIDRIHRIGQQRDVEVVRYVVSKSIELYVRWVQIDKLRLIKDSLSPSEQKTESVNEVRWKKLLEYLE